MAQANIKAVITAEDRASAIIKKFGDTADGVGEKINNSAKRASQALIVAATAATGFAIKSAANFEQTRIGLENMLGSADKARILLKDISKFAAETPFEFPELAQATRQLVAFGFTGDEAYETMKQLGNVSAAVGAPIQDLAYLMGTLKAQGRAFTIDIRQFAMRGIPIYEYLGKVLNKNTQEITEMIEAGKIGFPEVQAAFKLLAGEGGKWGDTMSRQSKSLSGLFSTLKDNIGQAAREMVGITREGDIKEGSLFAALRDGVTALNNNIPNIVQKLKEFGNEIANVGKKVAEYLQPKLETLWKTIQESWPTYKEFYENILKPLAELIGTTLVLAIGFLIDALNFLLEAFKPVISFLSENEHIFWGIVAVLGAIRTALFLQGALAAFQGVMAGVQASYAVTAGIIATPIAMPAIAVGAALLALWSVRDAAFKAHDAVQNAKNAAESLEESNAAVKRRLQAGLMSSDPAVRDRSAKALKGLGFASGGFTGRGSPTDVAGIVHKGEYVLPQQFVDQNSGQPKIASPNINLSVNVGIYAGTEVEKRKLAKELMRSYQDAMSMRGSIA